ncbi:MAG: MBL fold metallo-hydrolase [Desulfobacteraceae bacterium]|nr:MBL fold metallo-hydrolase [Desulfobacteraceae bacterium]
MKKTKITILGSGTCVPSLKRSSCSILIQGETQNFLLDAGPGTMNRLLQAGLKLNDVDAIFLSHFHLDHCAEVAAFLFATKYPDLLRDKTLFLVGGTGIRLLYENMNNTYGNTIEITDEYLKIVEVNEDGSSMVDFKGFRISHIKVNHKEESRAYRFTDSTGFTVVYSGDTDYSENLIDLSKNADVLICESAFPDEKKTPGHLTPSLAGDIAAKANVKKLVLTHFYPECENFDIEEQCKKSFSGPVILANDLIQIE